MYLFLGMWQAAFVLSAMISAILLLHFMKSQRWGQDYKLCEGRLFIKGGVDWKDWVAQHQKVFWTIRFHIFEWGRAWSLSAISLLDPRDGAYFNWRFCFNIEESELGLKLARLPLVIHFISITPMTKQTQSCHEWRILKSSLCNLQIIIKDSCLQLTV